MNDPMADALMARMAEFSSPVGENLPEEIQWMPPGEHVITATNQANQTVTRKIQVDESGARAVQASLEAMSASGRKPYLDFDHDDKQASAHVEGFRWAGTDPKTGGIRARVKWTASGASALKGRDYQSFSPHFLVSATGRVLGTKANMGGLVNKPAFEAIQSIWSKQANVLPASDTNSNQQKNMDADIQALKAKNAELESSITALKAKLATAESDTQLKAKDAEIANLKKAIGEKDAELLKARQANAKQVVDEAVRDGRLAPQATELHAKWVDTLTEDPTRVEMLKAMKATVVPAGSVTGGGNAAASAPAKGATFPAAVDAVIKAGKAKTKADAIGVVRQENPELHAEWLKSGGGQI